MLTKQEREEIANRLNECSLVSIGTLYNAVFGKDAPDATSYDEDVKALFRRVIDLCGTSNMIELPYDKNGDVICLSDEVYNEFGDEFIVKSITYEEEGKIYIHVHNSLCNTIDIYLPFELVHKYKSKYEQLAEKLETIVYKDVTDGITASRIFEIVNELRELGDDND